MCGIVAYVGADNGVPFVIDGLRRLEYRGYDSAGLALIAQSKIRLEKKVGSIDVLARALTKKHQSGVVIGHTRWATHGEPSDLNAHPHTDAAGQLAVVHNGIIENAVELRQGLKKQGIVCTSDTDTEILAHLIALALSELQDLEGAVRQALKLVTGTYGLAVISKNVPNALVVASRGSPLVLGVGQDAMYIASDPLALVRYTQQVVYLEDEEIAWVDANGYRVSTLNATPSLKQEETLEIQDASCDKGNHTHFMHKEIFEQARTLARGIKGRLDQRFSTARLDGLNLSPTEIKQIKRVKVLGCGSAQIAGLAGAHMLEQLARLPSQAESAAEFLCRNPVIESDTLFIAVSQSGETYDTLAAVQEIQRKGGTVIGVVNVVGSAIARACKGGIYLHAGDEISVASTKAVSGMLLSFALLALYLGRIKDLSAAEGRRLVDALLALPETVEQILSLDTELKALALHYDAIKHAYFVGRAQGFPVAMEGALKLKEVSYIHAEAYPIAELKHGPLAMISPDLPTFIIFPDDDLKVRNLNSVEEIKARGGPVIGFVQQIEDKKAFDHAIVLPKLHPVLDSILLLIPLQLFAYHAALLRACDIDRPRNLAKSVTVE